MHCRDVNALVDKTHAPRYFTWLMRCSNMEPRIFAGPNGQFVQECRNSVQSTSNKNPYTRKSSPHIRPECVSQLEKYPELDATLRLLPPSETYLTQPTLTSEPLTPPATTSLSPSSANEVSESNLKQPSVALSTQDLPPPPQSQAIAAAGENTANRTIEYAVQEIEISSANISVEMRHRINKLVIRVKHFDVDDDVTFRTHLHVIVAVLVPMFVARRILKLLHRACIQSMNQPAKVDVEAVV